MENSETGQKVPDKPVKVMLFSKYKKLLITISFLALIVVVGVLISFRSVKHNKIANNKTVDVNSALPLITPQPPAQGYEKVLYDADQLINKADYNGAIKLLEANVPKNSNKAQLYALESRIGYCYRSKSDWQNAIQWFDKAQATGRPEANGLNPVIGEMAEKAGDKPKAIAAYKRAYDLLANDKDPIAQKIASTYQQKIKDLGGS